MEEKPTELPVSQQEAQIQAPVPLAEASSEGGSFLDKLKIHKFKILGGVFGGLILVGAVFGAYKFGQRQAQPGPGLTPTPEAVATPTPLPSEAPAEEGDSTANWKTYRGKYFSFKHPQDWTDNTGPAANYPDNLEVIGLRISPNAVFETSYKNYSYEKNVQGLADRKSSKLTVSSREATRFEVTGSGEPLPSGFSIISFVVKGTGDTSYSIVFNGDRKDITEELINQILSTFQFLD